MLSVLLDDEAHPGLERDAVDAARAHVASCADCAVWEEAAFALKRRLALRTATQTPDFTGVIMARAGVPQLGRGEWLRSLLGAISIVLFVRNMPLLVFGDQSGVGEHAGRHLGAFGVALAIGLGYAALRPERAVGLLPLAGAFGVALLVTGVIDTATGSSGLLDEALHLLELAGVVVLWVISGGPWRLREQWARRGSPVRGRPSVGLGIVDT